MCMRSYRKDLNFKLREQKKVGSERDRRIGERGERWEGREGREGRNTHYMQRFKRKYYNWVYSKECLCHLRPRTKEICSFVSTILPCSKRKYSSWWHWGQKLVELRFAPCSACRPWDDLVLVMPLWASTSSHALGRVVPSLRFVLGWITDRNEAVSWISPLACGPKQEKHPSFTCFPISCARLGVVLSLPQTRSRGSFPLAQYFKIEPTKR